jgi:ubiquinone/menaquinone biosynthesis C-methylase UbiE
MPMAPITLDEVTRALSAHIPLYSWHRPVYQHVALTNLQRMWTFPHKSVLDVGGGTGIVAQTVKTLFSVDRVASVDIEDRYLSNLDIETSVYDGQKLPFPDGAFDGIIIFNVLHHVPILARAPLLRECLRVAGDGPIYIKDHLSGGTLDDARLAVLDLLGNVPFHGMVSARYLRDAEWLSLARSAGFREAERLSGEYRSGAFGALFPNRLEISMKWLPL